MTGIVEFYIVKNGKHPFGKEPYREGNLVDGNPVYVSKLEGHAAKDLISWMLSHDPKERPSAVKALKQTYLQLEKERFNMLTPDVLKYYIYKTYKYDSSWTECLRLIRNASQHWNDRVRPKPQPEAYCLVDDPLVYFVTLFHNHPTDVHRSMMSSD